MLSKVFLWTHIDLLAEAGAAKRRKNTQVHCANGRIIIYWYSSKTLVTRMVDVRVLSAHPGDIIQGFYLAQNPIKKLI